MTASPSPSLQTSHPRIPIGKEKIRTSLSLSTVRELHWYGHYLPSVLTTLCEQDGRFRDSYAGCHPSQ